MQITTTGMHIHWSQMQRIDSLKPCYLITYLNNFVINKQFKACNLLMQILCFELQMAVLLASIELVHVLIILSVL